LGNAKDIILRPISRKDADELIKRVHYSGKVVQNSQLHIGAFYDGRLEGAMQFGPSLDKRKIMGLVADTKWHEFMELNRLAFTEALPRNSESRALSVAMRIIRKNAPQIKWVISFADATQCGDGTIYRASGFVLTGIKANGQILDWCGRLIAKKTLDNTNYQKVDGKYYSRVLLETGEAVAIPGFQLRYIYFIDPSYRARLTVKELPYSEIERRGAGMYKGQPRGQGEIDNAPQTNGETGGASPTCPLSVDVTN
jgi:hypothetical protein